MALYPTSILSIHLHLQTETHQENTDLRLMQAVTVDHPATFRNEHHPTVITIPRLGTGRLRRLTRRTAEQNKSVLL